MAAKALIELDIQIAVWRDRKTVAREPDDWSDSKLQELLAKRQELLPQMIAERSAQPLFAK